MLDTFPLSGVITLCSRPIIKRVPFLFHSTFLQRVLHAQKSKSFQKKIPCGKVKDVYGGFNFFLISIVFIRSFQHNKVIFKEWTSNRYRNNPLGTNVLPGVSLSPSQRQLDLVWVFLLHSHLTFSRIGNLCLNFIHCDILFEIKRQVSAWAHIE